VVGKASITFSFIFFLIIISCISEMEIDKNLVKNIFICLAKFGEMIKTLTKYIVKW
jgi:hypothetical protein